MCQSLNQPQHMDIDEPIRKRVRFTAELELVREVDAVHDKTLWYSNKDFSVFRNSARETCEKVHTMGPSKSLEMNAFLTKNCNQAAMDHWSLHGQSDRGFESFANPLLGQARKRQRARCIKSVMIAQAVAREQQEAGKDMDVSTFLSFVASKESGKAKKFAMMMGKADENAIYRPEPAQRRISCLVAASA